MIKIFLSLALIIVSVSGCSRFDLAGEGTADPKSGLSWLPFKFAGRSQPVLEQPSQAWWESFGSSELDSFVQQALSENFDLKSAVARLEQARAQMIIDGSARFPTIDVTAGGSLDGPTGGVGTVESGAPWYIREMWQIGAVLNYEVNLWGRDQFNSEAAYNRALASEFGRQTLSLSLTSGIVQTYYEALALTERVRVAEQNLAAVSAIERGLQSKLEQGGSTLIEVIQQRILVLNVSSQVDALENQRQKALSRLAVLTGQPPGSIKFSEYSVTDASLPLVDAGLPSDLLCRRPDIKRAEVTLLSANLDLQAARANLLPSFTMSGGIGQGSFELSNILAPESLFINATADLVQNIFDGGRRKAEVALASARKKEFLYNYANTVLIALQEVQDALVGVDLSTRQYKSMQDASKLGAELSRISVDLLERGGMDYLQLFEIQRTVLETQDLSVVARYNQILSTVNLMRAIGGSFNASEAAECAGDEPLPQPSDAWSRAAGQTALRPQPVSY